MRVSQLSKKYGLSNKDTIRLLRAGGVDVKFHTNAVDEKVADDILGSQAKVEPQSVQAPTPPPQATNVVDINEARKAAKPKPKPDAKKPKAKKAAKPKKAKSDSNEWYAKYQWVVKGSVREPTAADKKALGSKCHGRVCTVKCVDTGAQRVVNTQDAFQSKRSPEAQKKFMRRRRAERRQTRKDAKAAKKANGS